MSSRSLWAALVTLVLAQASFSQNAEDVKAAYDQAVKLVQAGKLTEATEELDRVVKLAETVYGSDHLNAALYMNEVASKFWEIGMHAKAEPLYQRSLGIREAKLG